MNCIRCGRDDHLEEHHIIERVKGGSDETENKEWQCKPCHKYEHARRNILATLEKEKKREQVKRVAVLEHRLEVLDRLNTVALIRERGTYQSYWAEKTTHYFPPYISSKHREQNQLVMNLEGRGVK